MIFIFNIEFVSSVLKKHITGQVNWLPVVAASSVHILPMSLSFSLFAILAFAANNRRRTSGGLCVLVCRPAVRALFVRQHLFRVTPLYLYLVAGFQ